MRQVKELLAQMKNCYQKLKFDGKSILEAEKSLGQDGAMRGENEMQRRATMKIDGVGEIQDQGEFGLGVAPRDSRPVNKIELTKEKEAEIREAQAYEEYAETEDVAEEEPDGVLEAARLKMIAKKRKHVEKQTAFLEFKSLEQGS
jgi:hypothetical protein